MPSLCLFGMLFVMFSWCWDYSYSSSCLAVRSGEQPCTGGCTQGFYGSSCTERCSENCDGACSQDSGHCLTGCKSNWFTYNCSQPCSGNCVDDVCDRKSGECIHGCNDGFYGLSCNMRCSGNCTDGTCDIFGGCYCKEGKRDEACYINCDDCIGGVCAAAENGQMTCPLGCKEGYTGSFCKELKLGEGLFKRQAQQKKRKTREIRNCHEQNEDGTCSCCQEKWRGPYCDIPCPTCRYSYRDGCTLVCVGGTFGSECHLDCPADCSRATDGKSRCNEKGECDSGCLQGSYGYICQHTCPTTCTYRICFMNNGSCTDGCIRGQWGPRCEYECGNCKDMLCERDGSCSCVEGYYGPRCINKCTEHCQSGNCTINQNGDHICDGECLPSYTGEDCLSRCPPSCYNNSCDKESGVCGATGHHELPPRGPILSDLLGLTCTQDLKLMGRRRLMHKKTK